MKYLLTMICLVYVAGCGSLHEPICGECPPCTASVNCDCPPTEAPACDCRCKCEDD